MESNVNDEIEKAFAKDSELAKDIIKQYGKVWVHAFFLSLMKLGKTKSIQPLVHRICKYINTLQKENESGQVKEAGSLKRKDRVQHELGQLVYGVLNLSFQAPMRKKLDVYIYENGIAVTLPGEPNLIEFWLPWNEIRCAIHVPCPRKANVQNNFVIILKSESSAENIVSSDNVKEPVFFTAPYPLKKLNLVEGLRSFTHCTNSWDIFRDYFEFIGTSTLSPSVEEFVCPNPQTGDNGTTYGVEANYKAKDGMQRMNSVSKLLIK